LKGTIHRAAGLLIGAVFLISALGKGMDIVRFSRQIETLLWSMGFLQVQTTTWIAGLAAVAVIAIELIIGSCLLTGFLRRIAAVSSSVLLLFFCFITAWAAWRGALNECGCFGVIWNRSPSEALVDDILLLLIAILAIKDRRASSTESRLWMGRLFAMGIFLVSLFYIAHPLHSTAIRAGVRWQGDISGINLTSPNLIWVFDPDCKTCQKELNVVNRYTTDSTDYRMIGVTKATEGRVAEFKYDYDPLFPIFRTNEAEFDKLSLPSGSLFLIKNSRVKHVWREHELPVSSLEIAAELKE
jgi:uncharacterized membrane protein YphA (DoxX/SURF4 family)